jgi:hypothetical protein
MKLKLALAVGLLVSAFAAIDAHADCRLTVNPSSYILRGQSFSYGVELWDFSPLDPNAAFTVVFFGAKNGVLDILPPGEAYPGVFYFGSHNLTGYGNPPSGGFSGDYLRYAVIFDRGNFWCMTNSVEVVLQ